MAPLSESRTILLGGIAGVTIFFGLPLGRMRKPSLRLKTFLNAISAGILLFLLFDILKNAIEPLEASVVATRTGGSAMRASMLALVFVIGLGVGLMLLVYQRRVRGWFRLPAAGFGPGAMARTELSHAEHEATRLGMMIASGIGLHNFSEGLAIGQSAHKGEVSLALLLVIGFALHNATEGFGIVGPLAAAGIRASWPYLLLAGLIGGGPTFLGTIIGVSFVSTYVFVGFLALAAGAIIYVIAELLHVGRRMASWELTMWGLLAGFLIGLATEMVVAAAGV